MGLVTAFEESGKSMPKAGYQVIRHGRRAASVVGDPNNPRPNGPPIGDPSIPKVTLVVRADSFKGIYRKLKAGTS
jgi:hypothetical protein